MSLLPVVKPIHRLIVCFPFGVSTTDTGRMWCLRSLRVRLGWYYFIAGKDGGFEAMIWGVALEPAEFG